MSRNGTPASTELLLSSLEYFRALSKLVITTAFSLGFNFLIASIATSVTSLADMSLRLIAEARPTASNSAYSFKFIVINPKFEFQLLITPLQHLGRVTQLLQIYEEHAQLQSL